MADKISELARCIGIALHDLKEELLNTNAGGKCLGYLDYEEDHEERIGFLTGEAKIGDFYIVRYSPYVVGDPDYYAMGLKNNDYMIHRWNAGLDTHTVDYGTIDGPTSKVVTGDIWRCIINTEAATTENYEDIVENWVIQSTQYTPLLS